MREIWALRYSFLSRVITQERISHEQHCPNQTDRHPGLHWGVRSRDGHCPPLEWHTHLDSKCQESASRRLWVLNLRRICTLLCLKDEEQVQCNRKQKPQLHLFISFKFIVVKHRKIVLKWRQKSKVPQRAKSTMKKENGRRGGWPYKILTSYTTIIIKSVWYWLKNREKGTEQAYL